jgi:multidrug resistance efflux pump
VTNQPKSLAGLKDSRLLYEKKLPAFGYLIIALVSLLLVGVLIWSIFTPKVYIIKGSGVIESENKNYIMSGYSGEIREINIRNGDYVEKGDMLFSVKSTDLNLQQIQIEGKIEIYEKQIEQLQNLEKSIIEDNNLFDQSNPDDRQYYNQFETYKAQVAQNTIDVSQYKSYGYTDAQIEVEVKKNEAKISEIYHSTLKSVGEAITGATTELENTKTQGEAIAEGQSEYEITASTSGIVYLSTDYKQGMVIQAGSAIGSIANENDAYTIKAYINVNDMPRVNKGDDVDVTVAGLLESVYGTIPGKLVRIDSDVTTQQSNNQNGSSESGGASYFRLDIEPNASYLISKSGKKFNLSNGTAVETRIKYDEVSYFGYFLESIGILVR